jgi:hypothetical protein
MTTTTLATALAGCAAGLYPLEAGVALLIAEGTFLNRDFTDLGFECPWRPPIPCPGASRTALPTAPLTSATCARSQGKRACKACRGPTSPRCALDLDVTDMFAT